MNKLIVNVNYTVFADGLKRDFGLLYSDDAPCKTVKPSMKRMLTILPQLSPTNWFDVCDQKFIPTIIRKAPNKSEIILALDDENYVVLYVEVVRPDIELASPGNYWVQAKQNNWTKELTITQKLIFDRCFAIDSNFGAIIDTPRGKDIYEQAVQYITTEYIISKKEQAKYDKICEELGIN